MSDQEWNYDVPKDKCSIQEQRAFAQTKPYRGAFRFGSRMKRKITQKDMQNSLRLFNLSSGETLPDNFSWRDQPGICGPRNQGDCGCCWSFSIACALGDRYFIKYQKDYNLKDIIHLSPVWLVSIAYKYFSDMFGDTINSSNTCDSGGDPFLACEYLSMSEESAKSKGYINSNPGIKLDVCWPYQLINSKNQNTNGSWIFPNDLSTVNNNKACWNCTNPNSLNGKDEILFKIREGGVKNLLVMSGDVINKEATTKAIQKDLQVNGPMICGFQIYESFMDYWHNLKPTPNKKPEKISDIFMIDSTNPGKSSGGHAVNIVGWGTFANTNQSYNNGKPIRYWIMRNSWGVESADSGYGYIAFAADWNNNKLIEVDIPNAVERDENNDVIWQGGMFGITPGEFPKKYLEYYKNKKLTVDNYQNTPVNKFKSFAPFDFIKNYIGFIIGICGVCLIIGIFIGIFIGKKM